MREETYPLNSTERPLICEFINSSNHPGKLTKLGSELEKRLRTECRKAKAGNIRSRACVVLDLLPGQSADLLPKLSLDIPLDF